MFLQDLTSDLTGKNPPVEITAGKDFIYTADFFAGKLYITTNEDAPRYRVFVADATNPRRENWKEIIPQTDAVLQGASVTGGKLLAQYQRNATSELKLFGLDGKKLADVPLPAIGSVFSASGRYDRHEIFFGFQSFTVPPSIYRVDLSDVKSSLWAKVDAPVSIPGLQGRAGLVHVERWHESPDVCRQQKGNREKRQEPHLAHRLRRLQRVGDASFQPQHVSVDGAWRHLCGRQPARRRRMGEEWHRAGMLEKKQNVFDDFIAAGEYLIAQKYTDRDHLAIQGGSNGGLLMGAMITQRPDLFRAVVCQVPLLDMLRYQNFQIAKLWIPEYGSADNAKQFGWLYAYSPYHHVKPGQEYPAILFMTGDTDTRVDPMHAKKMAALLQAEAKNGDSQQRPILLRIETKAGHGQGKPVTKQIEESTDIYSFLFWQLGVKP